MIIYQVQFYSIYNPHELIGMTDWLDHPIDEILGDDKELVKKQIIDGVLSVFNPSLDLGSAVINKYDIHRGVDDSPVIIPRAAMANIYMKIAIKYVPQEKGEV